MLHLTELGCQTIVPRGSAETPDWFRLARHVPGAWIVFQLRTDGTCSTEGARVSLFASRCRCRCRCRCRLACTKRATCSVWRQRTAISAVPLMPSAVPSVPFAIPFQMSKRRRPTDRVQPPNIGGLSDNFSPTPRLAADAGTPSIEILPSMSCRHWEGVPPTSADGRSAIPSTASLDASMPSISPSSVLDLDL